VLHAGTLFQVADREFDAGMVAMERVKLDRGCLEIGQEREVPPVGPELLVRADEACSADDEASPLVGRLGDLGKAVWGVRHFGPGLLGNRGNRRGDSHVVGVQVSPQFSGLAFKLSSTPAFT